MAEVTLKLPAVHCAGCISSLHAVLRLKPGISSLKGDARTKLVSVAYDEGMIDVGKIRQALAAAGFPPDETESS